MKPATPPARIVVGSTGPAVSASAQGRPPPLKELWRQQRYFRQAGWLSLAIAGLMLVPSWYMFEVYGRVLDSRNVRTLAMLVICVIGLNLVLALLEQVRLQVLESAGQEMDRDLRRKIFDAAFSRQRKPAGGPMQIFTDLRTLREFVGSTAVTAMLDLPGALLFLALMFAFNTWLGALALLGVLIQVGLIIATERRTMPLLSEAVMANASAQNYAAASLRSAPVIEAMGMLPGVHERWNKRQRLFLARQSQASDHATTNAALAKMVQTMQGSLLLGAAAFLLLRHDLVGGGSMLIIASIIGSRILAPLSQLVTQWRAVVTARDAYRRVAQTIADQDDAPPGMPLPAPKGVLTVEGLTAGAGPAGPPILRGVNFGIQPGDAVAVIGPAASGKTTLARVLVGLWPTLTGKVRLDGVDVHTWNKEELGPHLGYLPQSVELFDGTVAENIARFGKVDMDKVRAAADQAGIVPMIEALPQGYDTRIGDDGAVLSGGQRQRVALARAIYGDPRLIVLDEPNSSLDDAGEKALVELIRRLRERGATVVVISHRIGILPAVNRLLVLRDGQMAMFGARDDVLQKLKEAAEALKNQPRTARRVIT